MSKIKKTDLLTLLQEQAEMIVELSSMIKMNKQSIIKLENEREQNSLIERKELTGSDLTRSILSKQFMQACLVSDSSDKAARQGDDLQLIRMYNETDGKFISMRDPWHGCHHKYAVAVDNNRKPLTQSDVGL